MPLTKNTFTMVQCKLKPFYAIFFFRFHLFFFRGGGGGGGGGFKPESYSNLFQQSIEPDMLVKVLHLLLHLVRWYDTLKMDFFLHYFQHFYMCLM